MNKFSIGRRYDFGDLVKQANVSRAFPFDDDSTCPEILLIICSTHARTEALKLPQKKPLIANLACWARRKFID